MTEGNFPKSDGDIFYASEANLMPRLFSYNNSSTSFTGDRTSTACTYAISSNKIGTSITAIANWHGASDNTNSLGSVYLKFYVDSVLKQTFTLRLPASDYVTQSQSTFFYYIPSTTQKENGFSLVIVLQTDAPATGTLTGGYDSSYILCY